MFLNIIFLTTRTGLEDNIMWNSSQVYIEVGGMKNEKGELVWKPGGVNLQMIK